MDSIMASPMTGKIVTFLLALFTVGLGVPSCFVREWRLEIGMPTKKMGLLSLEVNSCHNAGPAMSSGSGALSIAKAGADLLGNLGCTAVSHESQNGIMTWVDYQTKTCHDASSSAMCLGSIAAGGALDPTGYCAALRERCQRLEGAKTVNYFTLSAILVGCICMTISGVNIFREDRGKTICYSGACSLLLLSAVVVYWGLGEEYFKETSMTSSTTEGTCMYTSIGSLVCSWMQTFCCVVCLRNDSYDDSDDEETGRSKKKHKHSKLKEAAAAQSGYGTQPAQPDAAVQNVADHNLRMMSQAIKQMGGSDLATAFRGFDVNGDGCITQQEFMSGMAQLNLGLNAEQTTWLMGWLDVNKDGYVAYSEFVDVMQRYEQNPGYVHQAGYQA